MLRTNVYIDGFNLYYGALKNRPRAKWLDLSALCSILLTKNDVHRIRYFTARVQARSNSPNAPRHQAVYFRALRTIPNLSIHFGHFLSHPVRLPLNSDPTRTVEVIRTEEKGSDVNLATHLLWDGFQDDYECAVIISNDSDLAEPIRVVKNELGRPSASFVHTRACPKSSSPSLIS